MGCSYRNPEVPMSGNPESHYVPTHQYTQRPKAITDYPNTPYNGFTPNPNTEPIGTDSHRYAEGDFVSPGFFQHIDCSIFTIPKVESEWIYNMRRTAQRILQFLYLGPWSCLTDRQWLKEKGITLLLSVRDQRLARLNLVSGQTAASELGIQSDSFDVWDGRDLISRLPQAIKHINDHIYASEPGAAPKKVLLFCETGNGLSALVAMAYVMVMLNMGMNDALNFLHSRRFCIDMEDSLKPLLVAFGEILEAKRDVEAARRATVTSSHLAAPTMTLSKKRSFADQVKGEGVGDDDMEMEASSPERKPQAPFQDRWG